MEDIIELIKTGQNELLQLRFNHDPSLANKKTEQGISLLQFAAYCRNITAIDILKKYKQKLDFFEAASIGDNETISQILKKKPELLNSFSTDGFTALGLASFFGHVSLVEYLLEKGADPNIASNNQFKVAPIHSACASSSFDIARLLIKYHADVNASQMQGVTPLHSAAHNGQTNLLKLLVENGANVNAKTDDGQTALSMANEKNFKETAEVIINYGGTL